MADFLARNYCFSKIVVRQTASYHAGNLKKQLGTNLVPFTYLQFYREIDKNKNKKKQLKIKNFFTPEVFLEDP